MYYGYALLVMGVCVVWIYLCIVTSSWNVDFLFQNEPPESTYKYTTNPLKAPDTPTKIEIEFSQGKPVKVSYSFFPSSQVYMCRGRKITIWVAVFSKFSQISTFFPISAKSLLYFRILSNLHFISEFCQISPPNIQILPNHYSTSLIFHLDTVVTLVTWVCWYFCW